MTSRPGGARVLYMIRSSQTNFGRLFPADEKIKGHFSICRGPYGYVYA